MTDWLGSQRTDAACDRILDAASELFAVRGVEAVAMNDVARAAGCSRATLYRYFPSRDALHTAYVHRHARAVNRHIADLIAPIADPRDKMLAALTHALRLVRDHPALAAWFTRTPIGAQAAAGSSVIQEMTADFILSTGSGDGDGLDRQARWLVRVLTSFLTVPGRDAAEERATLEEFVLPRMLACRDSQPQFSYTSPRTRGAERWGSLGSSGPGGGLNECRCVFPAGPARAEHAEPAVSRSGPQPAVG